MEPRKKELAQKYREEHVAWRNINFETKQGFFPVFYGFEKVLPKLSGGAVSLFIYIGIHSNNKTGECYHNIETISRHFGVSSRTVSTWFKELQKNSLIERVQIEYNGVSHTFIRPYTTIQEKEKREDNELE